MSRLRYRNLRIQVGADHRTTHTVHIRDSKDLTVPALAVSSTTWTSFVEFAAS
ncbi:DUF397 domain-containing protein [Streptomyces sp. NPDC101178]|uniref:DUF397 domain-containing protein n=1 Tax=Streptomyces sp. NPDC101178 TaxID=3366124 RepID=UPI00380DCE52